MSFCEMSLLTKPNNTVTASRKKLEKLYRNSFFLISHLNCLLFKKKLYKPFLSHLATLKYVVSVVGLIFIYLFIYLKLG